MTGGPPDGPPVLLLHGFPECWYGWHRQLPALIEAGYRVVVPDQRGYGTSDRPRQVAAYRLEALMADVLGLVDALALDRPHLVAHDWGGAVAWGLARTHPERFRSFVPMNIPDPWVMLRELAHPRQLRRSWYIFLFQVPGLERMLARDRHQALVSALFGNSVHRPFTAADLATYREAWSQPGSVRGMLNWYRAALRHLPPEPARRCVPLPACMIWGRQDAALGFPMVAPSMAHLPHGELHVIDDAAHFVQHDRPDLVVEHLLDFLGRVDRRG